jgi:hypothetical protein
MASRLVKLQRPNPGHRVQSLRQDMAAFTYQVSVPPQKNESCECCTSPTGYRGDAGPTVSGRATSGHDFRLHGDRQGRAVALAAEVSFLIP